jgi:hypothetical protein
MMISCAATWEAVADRARVEYMIRTHRSSVPNSIAAAYDEKFILGCQAREIATYSS